MGFQNIVHGRICLKGDFEKSKAYIRSLEKDKVFPFIRTEMFGLGANESPYFYEAPIISFGSSYKDVDHAWQYFMIKFETILRNIEFDTARIELETEIFGTYHFFWKSRTDTTQFEEKEKLIETDAWFFGFGHRDYWGYLTEPLEDRHIFRLFDFTYPVKNLNQYDLYWQDIKIGVLTQTYWDIRNSGTIVYAFDYLAEFPENKRLADSIKHSIKTFQYIEESDQENYEKMCEKDETEYTDFIDSPNWRVMDCNGKSIKILCPIFLENNEINWQED